MAIIYKIPEENVDYPQASAAVIDRISAIIGNAIRFRNNLIFIRTNLRRVLPLEDINKIAGPFVQAWAVEQFEEIADDIGNEYELIHVQTKTRLSLADVILQFKRGNAGSEVVTATVDVKATAEDIKSSGKSPNITSYARIRTQYLDDPDLLFVILSLTHKVYGEKEPTTGMTNGIMEVTGHAVYDLKYLSSADLSYNPALGTGQLQIRDIRYVTLVQRTTWEFLQLLDAKFVKSKGEETWLRLARKFAWIKEE